MLEYIRLDYKTPILKQISPYFNSAAFLFHPFIQMPEGWTEKKRERPFQHIYPSDEEILQHGKPVSWGEMMRDSGISSSSELALALMTSISALRGKNARDDLADKLDENMGDDLYYPCEDQTSVFLIPGLVDILGSRTKRLYLSDPIEDQNRFIDLNENPTLDITELASAEYIITDENLEFAWMSIYDSFITLFMAKEDSIEGLIQDKGWEAFICNERTISWFMQN